jgi:RNA polymerase sigma-70 factor (ECF subfamily)
MKALLSDQAHLVAPAREPSALVAGALPTLRELFTMHAAYVWNTLRRFGVPACDLEDVTHDVFLQIHRHFAEYDPHRPVRPWLVAFAYRAASQHRRRAHRRRETQGEPDAAAHPGAPPDEQLAADDDRRLVAAALSGIGLERRAVFVLYELDGIAMDDIAGSLGIPVNTAYSRLRIARGEFASAVKRLRPRRSDG